MKIPFSLELSDNEALFDWVAGKVALCRRWISAQVKSTVD